MMVVMLSSSWGSTIAIRAQITSTAKTSEARIPSAFAIPVAFLSGSTFFSWGSSSLRIRSSMGWSR